MKAINSKDNSIIKEIKKLNIKKYRTENKRFLIEGIRFVEEALKSEFNIPYIFVCESLIGKIEGNINLKKSNTEVYLLNEKLMKYICNTQTPQGIAAVIDMKEDLDLDTSEGVYILVDRIQDPGNMGTIIRTAHAIGAKGIIVTKGTVDVYNDKTLRSTMGSIFKVPIICDDNGVVVNNLRSEGYELIVSTLNATESFYDVDLTGKILLTIGNEGNGICKKIIDSADKSVKIPMVGDAESLNVAVAAAVMMYEALRQKLKKM
ncbi:RNA methyltransferase [Clostridium sediminicola]|uniref:TrmH family RNA methyltransferase n=1 Tax=Clostridium sediminicola TaxID=3114879 RepID=UPI0031F2116F